MARRERWFATPVPAAFDRIRRLVGVDALGRRAWVGGVYPSRVAFAHALQDAGLAIDDTAEATARRVTTISTAPPTGAFEPVWGTLYVRGDGPWRRLDTVIATADQT